MSTLMLYVGVAVTFLTVWGVIMVGGYLLGRESADESTAIASDWPTGRPVPDASDLVG
ncbi:MAG: hypothetical protein ABI949_07045 [Ilumatobacteraceae bacterium]